MADNLIPPFQGTGDTTPSVATDDVAGVHFQKMKINLGGDGVDGNTWNGNIGGTVAVSAATVTGGTIQNVVGGSIVVTNATVAGGTIQNLNNGSIVVTNGTTLINPKPSTNVLLGHAVGTAAIGTLVAAAGSGTSIFVSSLSIKVLSGTLDVQLGFGTAEGGTTVLERGQFVTNSGIARSFPAAPGGNITNTALVYKIISGTGTASWNVSYTTGV